MTRPAPSCRRLLVRVLRPVRRDDPVREDAVEPKVTPVFVDAAPRDFPVFIDALWSARAETPSGGLPQSSQKPSTIFPVHPGLLHVPSIKLPVRYTVFWSD